MEEGQVDLVLVPLGLVLMGLYHLWLFLTILRHPKRTVVGLNALTRHRWVKSMMTFLVFLFRPSSVLGLVFLECWINGMLMGAFQRKGMFGFHTILNTDPSKNGVLAVQTIRNSIMASTLLATTSITLTSIISVVVSNTTKSSTSSSLIYGNKMELITAIKYFTILLCFLVAFLCNVQSIRYYAHVSFLVSVSPPRDAKESVDYVARCLNRGSFFWSLGLRAFYVSFSLFLWIFGPIPMFVCCCTMSCLLYFLDTTSNFSRQLHLLLGWEEEGSKLGWEEEGSKLRDAESQQVD